MDKYFEHYQLMKAIAENPQIIAAPILYNFNNEEIFAAIMDRMAANSIDGTPSPLSSRSPGSAHARLAEAVTYGQSLLGHEINLIADFVWMNLFRMLGAEISAAEYPVINLVFNKTLAAANAGIKAEIPLGTEVRSIFDNSFIAYTTDTVEITGQETIVNVPARLNRLGPMPEIQIGEFSVLPRLLPFIQSVTNDGVVYNEGRNKETLTELMMRFREQMRIGERCVTLSDFYLSTTLAAGADKCNVVQGSQYGIPGLFDDLVTVVVYPEKVLPIVESVVRPRKLAGARLDIRGADIIPLDGTLSIRVVPHINDVEAFDLAANAIIKNINPPAGNWQDNNFTGTLVEALEQVEGIYAVPEVNLKHVDTNKKLEDIRVEPWHLFEIRNSLVINIVRS